MSRPRFAAVDGQIPVTYWENIAMFRLSLETTIFVLLCAKQERFFVNLRSRFCKNNLFFCVILKGVYDVALFIFYLVMAAYLTNKI